jgi:mRNA interferase RelE/StbE
MITDENEKSEQNVYRVELDDAASRDFDKLASKAKGQVAKLIDTLAANPRAGNVRELVGFKGVYRKRTGDYRVVYTIEEDVLVVIVVAVGPRKDVYERIKRRIK